MALDGDHVAREIRKDRGLIPRPGPDLEHVIGGAHIEKLCHPRDYVWLRDGLAFGDAKGMIAIRDILIFFTNEALPWHGRHCGEHPFVPDAHPTEIADHRKTLR